MREPDELPVYVLDDDAPTTRTRPQPVPVRETMGHLLERASAAVERATERLERAEHRDPSTAWTGTVDTAALVKRTTGLTFNRYLLIDPGAASVAFDRWSASTGTVVRARHGALLIRSRDRIESDGSRLRSMRTNLVIGWRHLPVPMELDLIALKSFMVAIELRLSRRFVKTVGSHRRNAYFEAGNAVLDRLTTELFAHRPN